jgi:16S rRNA (uracil1498-N3)-methyltransferase
MPSEKPIFYAHHISNHLAFLNSEESQHALKVLRLKPLNEVLVIDGIGNFYEGQIESISKKETTVLIAEPIEDVKSLSRELHLAVAPTKNISRMEWLLEKMTEVGLRSFTPVITQHTIRRNINSDRLQKILLAATKQSQRALIPKLNPLTIFDDFIRQPWEGKKYIAHFDPTKSKEWASIKLTNRKVCILIGPEGDFSLEELKLAIQAGFEPISLGPNRLRTETAGLYAGIVYQTKLL